MTDLPHGWVKTTVGEICHKPQYGWTSKASKSESSLRMLRTTDITRGPIDWASVPSCVEEPGDLDKYLLQAGDILVSRAGSVGFNALIANEPIPAVFASYLIRIRPIRIEPSFVHAFMKSPSYWLQIEESSVGIGMKNINAKSLAAIEIPVPPIPEQRRIVEVVDKELETISASDRTLETCRRRSFAMINAVIRDTFSPSGARRQAPELPSSFTDDGELPTVPSSWSWRRLGDIADVVGGITKDSSKQRDPEMPKVPYLRVANVQRGHLNLDQVAEIRATPRQVEKLRLQTGDVLLNEGGDRDKLGRGWVWAGQIEDCIHQNHVFRARIRGDVLHPKLLAWYANGLGHWFERNGKQSVNLASISLTTIKQLPVPVPPRAEQDAIVARLEDAFVTSDRLIDVLNSTSKRSAALRAAVLNDAFAGRLTQQDRDAEPASVLLEQIRAERAAVPPHRGRHRRAPSSTRQSSVRPRYDKV